MSPTGTPAKVVGLCARPSQAARLAFQAGGIIEQWNAALGTSVTAFDFPAFYAGLGATAASSPAQLQYDSRGIAGAPAVTASVLLALRAEQPKAALDSAVAARANAYYAKYGNQAAIIAQMLASYAPGSPGSKPQLLTDLATLAQ